MKETRMLLSGDLRQLCIRQNWYTRGDCDDYTALLNVVSDFDYTSNAEGINTEFIATIAKDIKDHSETEQPLTSICFEIARICTSYFEETSAE